MYTGLIGVAHVNVGLPLPNVHVEAPIVEVAVPIRGTGPLSRLQAFFAAQQWRGTTTKWLMRGRAAHRAEPPC